MLGESLEVPSPAPAHKDAPGTGTSPIAHFYSVTADDNASSRPDTHQAYTHTNHPSKHLTWTSHSIYSSIHAANHVTLAECTPFYFVYSSSCWTKKPMQQCSCCSIRPGMLAEMNCRGHTRQNASESQHCQWCRASDKKECLGFMALPLSPCGFKTLSALFEARWMSNLSTYDY
ncbi:hypothetical protein BC835DRAFT_604488 [Cytidiella melzeri]|nr:hypothetical protein BC835DRAFT_604488 [Cytidiella melzeri]